MPLMKAKSPKAFEHNFKAEMSAGKPKDQSLAIAYAVKRKAKKMARGGMVNDSAKYESRPMPNERDKDSSMVSRNSGKKALQDSQWTDNPTVAQAQRPSKTPLSQPRMVESSVIRARPLGMLKDDEAHIMDTMSPDGYGKQPKSEYNEDGASRSGTKVPDMAVQHNNKKPPYNKAIEDQYSQDMAAAEMKKTQAYAEGGMINNDVSMDAAEEDMVEHPAGLEEDDDQMAPAESEYMAGHFAEGGMAEMDEDHQDSIAAAIMSRKKAQMRLMSDSDEDRMVRMAEGGQVDLDINAEEQPNGYYRQNEDAALKENYDSDMDSMSQPTDSNEDGDMAEDDESDKHDMVSSIRKQMKSRKQF